MAVQLPQNQSITNKYTVGKEYMYLDTYKEYQGYYYEINTKVFAGKEFNSNALELIKFDSSKVNTLLTNPATLAYGKASGMVLTKENSREIASIPINLFKGNTKYFAKKINQFPLKIIAISEEDYKSNVDTNLFYAFTSIEYNIEQGFFITDQNKKDIPEIEDYLGDFSQNTD